MQALIPDEEFTRRIDDLITRTKAVATGRGWSEIFYPGEIEARAERTGRREGVRLPGKTIADLRALGDTAGVAVRARVVGEGVDVHRPRHLTVRPDHLDEFLEGIRINAQASLRDEPGCLRFDVHRDASSDPHRFLLYEIYTDADAFYSRAPAGAALRRLARGRRAVPRGRRARQHVRVPGLPRDIPENATHTSR